MLSNSKLRLSGLAFLTLVTSVFLAVIFISQPAKALEFNPSRIIEDSRFTDYDSMTVWDIQSFLERKVPVCDTWGEEQSEYGGGTRADYGRAHGVPPPYKCLKDYTQGDKSAARIIYEQSHARRINPKVLIVLLQKEQGLVTDEWPWPIQYRSATGYGCPDSADCDADYYGFANQVRWAATMFRAIMDDSPSWYTPYELGVNRIYWHPSRGEYENPSGNNDDRPGCGYTNVNIQNRATQALYNYTPYRPNQAALDAGYGTGNSCSSYGNRNFFNYFNDWFGASYIPDYRAELYARSNMFTIKPGLSKRAFIAYRNTGFQTWYDNMGRPEGELPTVLASTDPLYSKSLFNGLFEREDRPKIVFSEVLKSDGSPECDVCQNRVRPSQIVKFEFDMVAPMTLRSNTLYEEWFEPVKQHSFTMDAETRLNVQVPYLLLSSANAGTSGLRGARPGWGLTSFVKLKNTGNVVWYDSTSALPGVEPLTLSTADPTGRISLFSANYESPRRATSIIERVDAVDGTLATNQHTVRPGETAVFRFVMSVPDDMAQGVYTERLGLRFIGAPSLAPNPTIELKIKVLQPLEEE